MKLSLVFLVLALQVSAKDFGQRILSLKEQNVTLSEIFKKIEQKSKYRFYFSNDIVPENRIVSVNIQRATLEEVMKNVLAGTHLRWQYIDSNRVVISLALEAFKKTITGVVKDNKGALLGNVSVQIKGKTTGVVTQDNGHFSIDADPGDVLVFSIVGYTSEEITVNENNNIEVVLAPANNELDQIVVVGYGTQKKVNLTGAVATIGSKQIENRPVTGLTNALQGTMAGVTVVSNNGQPGKDAGTINIRGVGSLNNTNPLVIIDGIIGSLSSINPDDVENISVLKDAASAAIYGSRAANGVILITTKKGKKGVSQVQYNAYVGKQKATHLPDYLPSWQAATLYNQALGNEGKTLRWTDDDIQKFKNGSDPENHPNTDWLGLFYQGNGIQQNHYLDFSGGSDKTQYLFSLGYFAQNGLVKNTDAQRYTARINISSIVTKNLKINGSLFYTYAPLEEPTAPYPAQNPAAQYSSSFSQMIRQINRISPTVTNKYSNGYYGYITDGNPIAWLNNGGSNQQKKYTLQGVAGADWEPITGLHFKPSLGYQFVNDQNVNVVHDIQFYDHTTGQPSKYQGPNSIANYRDNSTIVTVQGLIDYTKSFKRHNIYLLGGYSQEYTNFNWSQVYRQNLLNNELSQINVAPTDGQYAIGSAYELALRSYFGRATYNYDNRYLLEANMRYDASSRFAPPNRWGFFPSFSGAWRISQEEFFAPLKSWVNDLKLRGSWGKLGNQNTVDKDGNATYYPYIATIATGQDYVFGGTSPTVVGGVAPLNGANPDIKWESTTMSGGGLDAAFLKNKIQVSVDYFTKTTNGILWPIPVAAAYGQTPPTINAASVQNKGWEITASYNGSTSNGISYTIGGNAAFIKNKVLSLDNTSPVINNGTIIAPGLPIKSFYGYISEGIFQTQQQVQNHAYQSKVTAPGDLIYKDLSGPNGKPDSIIDGNDRTYLGTSFPKITFGFNASATWKGFDVALFFQGAAGVKNYVQGIMLGQVSDGPGKPTSAMLNAWTPTNTSATFPRLWYGYIQNDPSRTVSSYWVRNAAYLRLKNLQVGYTLPENLTKKIGIKKARLYYSGQNILTFTSFYKWVDPESNLGNNGYYYPQVKVNTIGVNVTF